MLLFDNKEQKLINILKFMGSPFKSSQKKRIERVVLLFQIAKM